LFRSFFIFLLSETQNKVWPWKPLVTPV
jgi:hypothetical protein